MLHNKYMTAVKQTGMDSVKYMICHLEQKEYSMDTVPGTPHIALKRLRTYVIYCVDRLYRPGAGY